MAPKAPDRHGTGPGRGNGGAETQLRGVKEIKWHSQGLLRIRPVWKNQKGAPFVAMPGAPFVAALLRS